MHIRHTLRHTCKTYMQAKHTTSMISIICAIYTQVHGRSTCFQSRQTNSRRFSPQSTTCSTPYLWCVYYPYCGVFIIRIVVCLLSVLWCVYYQYCYYRMCSLTRVTPYSWCVCLTCMSYMRSLQNVFSY